MADIKTAKQENYSVRDIKEKLESILSDLNITDVIRGKNIIVKPNCTGIACPEEARTTHPAVVEALVTLLKDSGAHPIIAESSSFNIDTITAFDKTGIRDIAERTSTPLIDLKKSIYHQVPVIDGSVLKEIFLPQEFLDADLVFSVAKLKTNYSSTMSCSLKNMKGLLKDSQKREFHRIGLHEAVADLYSVVKDKAFAVIDGIIGSELYEPKAANILIASQDLASCDLFCADFMGIDKIRYLELVNASYSSSQAITAVPFSRTLPGLEALGKRFNVQIIDGKPCSSCAGSLYGALKKISANHPTLLDHAKIAVGDCDPMSHTLYYGTCACKGKTGRLVKGCPPTSYDLIESLSRG